jgi:hypothetical protein
MNRSGSSSAASHTDIPALDALAQHHLRLAGLYLRASEGCASDQQVSQVWSELNRAWSLVQTVEYARAAAIATHAATP